MRRAAAVCGAVAVGLWVAGAGVVADGLQGGTSRSVYVSVVDEDGQQVMGLTPDDFELKENGQEYPVTVGYPSERMHLAIMVEEIMAPDTTVRMAIFELAKRMLPQADIALMIVSNRAETVVEYTGDINAIVEGLNGFTIRNSRQAGNVADAIYDVARKIEEEAPARPAILAVALEMLQSSGERADRVLDQIRDSGAVFHAVTVEVPSGAVDAAMMSEMRTRNQVLGDGPRNSGGIRIQMRNPQGATEALAKVADQLSAQYLLSYTLPEGVDTRNRLEVELDRDGAELHAPSRIPE